MVFFGECRHFYFLDFVHSISPVSHIIVIPSMNIVIEAIDFLPFSFLNSGIRSEALM